MTTLGLFNAAARRAIAKPYWQSRDGRLVLHHGDCVEVLAGFDDGSVDLCITDPAYESLEKHRSVGTTTRLTDWFPIFRNAQFGGLFRELHRVMRADAHLYMFTDPETMFVAKPIGEAAGFTFWKPLIWDKQTIGMGYHYRARYECVLFFEKGSRQLADLGVPDVIEAPRVRNGYPTEKPVAVSDVFVAQSSAPDDVVLDPFCGSGSALVAARNAGRRAIGIDVSERALETAAKRLEAA